jgi:drug/metabolite transporter (DMT)-like permease
MKARGPSLLTMLIVTRAISWPVIEVGVATVPPIWFGRLRYSIAAVCLFGLVAVRGYLFLPPRSDWPLVVVSGALQMAAYAALTALALTVLSPGRASVLAFSTPIWVVPLAVWSLNEHISQRALQCRSVCPAGASG